MHAAPPTFERLVAVAEHRAARVAVRDVLRCLRAGRPRRRHNPLFLHGPPGTGKTALVSALVADLTHTRPDLAVSVVQAGDLNPAGAPEQEPGPDPLAACRQADVLVLEDVQHLSPRTCAALVAVLDDALARARQVVATALVGPRQLHHRGDPLPARLTSRLAAGLVVALTPLSQASRRAVLAVRAKERGLPVGPDVLDWLAEHLPGGARQLDGALTALEGLARLQAAPLDVATVAPHFRAQAEAGRVTVERIARRVGDYFQLEPRQLQSRQRTRAILVARQVGMYLARRLTDLSLEQIGGYFGGRDHTTVLHACRKVETTLGGDAVLAGAVRQLSAELT